LKHILVLAIFLCSLGHLSAQKSAAPAKTQWTLEDCIRYATEKNIAVLQAELSKKIQREYPSAEQTQSAPYHQRQCQLWF
jgi:hypothetical protein